MSALADAKPDLRREARRRLSLGAETDTFHPVHARTLLALPAFQQASTVLLFTALPREPDLREAGETLLRAGKRLVLPRVAPSPPGELTLHAVTSWEELHLGSFGIREPDPDHCPRVDPAEVDFAAVPGLAYDHTGTRLGRGGGYYDRLLARLRPDAYRCGVFYACQEFPHLPREPHDHPLHAFVTERGVMECARVL